MPGPVRLTPCFDPGGLRVPTRRTAISRDGVTRGNPVRVLAADAELAQELAPERLRRARADAVAETLELESGPWQPPVWPDVTRAGLGLLVLDGLLLRRLSLGGHACAELVGQGDILRPWQEEDPLALVERTAAWRVLTPAKLAVLDVEFAARIARYPEVTGELMGRAMRRARNLAVHLAITQQRKVEARIVILLGQLADRWGTVGRDGVLIPMTLSHAIVGELIAARRPTVTAELKKLERRGTITRTSRGLLLQEPLFERARKSIRER
jgi:CRP/FNR family cyclic AMP-dependent transcriptional regulator